MGPTRGSLVIAGGGDLGPEIWDSFVSLAGGERARIVVIPTAAPDEDLPDDWRGLDGLQVAFRCVPAFQQVFFHPLDAVPGSG